MIVISILFFKISSKTYGVITRYDAIILDEVKQYILRGQITIKGTNSQVNFILITNRLNLPKEQEQTWNYYRAKHPKSTQLSM